MLFDITFDSGTNTSTSLSPFLPLPEVASVIEQTRHFYIHGDDTFGEIDTKRLLLAYLYLIGWKGGSIFPSKKELADPPADGVYSTCINQATLDKDMKAKFKALGREDKLAMHSPKKSGFFFAGAKGVRDIMELLLASGHACAETTQMYLNDALCLVDLLKRQRPADPDQALGSWFNPFSSGNENATRITAAGNQWKKPLAELAEGFIQHRVGISPTDPQRLQVQYLIQKVIDWKEPSSEDGGIAVSDIISTYQMFYACISYTNIILFTNTHTFPHVFQQVLAPLNQDICLQVKACVAQTVHSKVSMARSQEREVKEKEKQAIYKNLEDYFVEKGIEVVTEDLERLVLGNRTLTTATILKRAAKKKSKAYLTKHALRVPPTATEKRTIDRSTYGKLDSDGQLKFIHESYDLDHSKYEKGSRNWLNRVRPIAMCFRNCCNHDPSIFNAKYPVWSVNKFPAGHDANKKRTCKCLEVK